MGVEEPNLADPSVYSGKSFSRWVINSNRALSTQERAPAGRKQWRCTRRKDLAQSVFALAALSRRSRVWCERDRSRGQRRYFLFSCRRPGTRRLPFAHSHNSGLLSRGFAKSAFYPHRALPHLRRVNSNGRTRGHTHTHQILNV